MRTTNEIIWAVKNSEPVTEEELKLALLALASVEFLTYRRLKDIVESEDAKPLVHRLRMDEGRRWLTENREATNKDPREWLGPENIPGNPAYEQRLAMGKRMLEKATGETLE